MERRTALRVIPLAIAGITAAAQVVSEKTASLPEFQKPSVTPKGVTPTKGVLDERGLRCAFYYLTDASRSGMSCSFVALAQHIVELARTGDCETIRETAESLIDCLANEHNRYDETRETWISEELGYFAEVVDMDDETLPETARDLAIARANHRDARRSGERREV